VGCPRTSSVTRHTGTATSRQPTCARYASDGPRWDSRQRPPSAPASSREFGGSATRRRTCRTAAPSQRRRVPLRPSLRLRRSPRQSLPWATLTPGRGVAGMASRRTYRPTGRAPSRGSGGASGDALGARVPAFAATPPPSRTPRTRRAPHPGAGKCCFLVCSTTASWPRWGWTSCPFVRSASSSPRGRAPTWSAGTPSLLTDFARWSPPRRRNRYVYETPTTRGYALEVPSRCGSRRAHRSSRFPSSSSTTCWSQSSWAARVGFRKLYHSATATILV